MPWIGTTGGRDFAASSMASPSKLSTIDDLAVRPWSICRECPLMASSLADVFGGLEGLHPTDPTHALRGSGRTLHDAPDHHGRNAREHGLGLRRRQYTAKNVPELTGLLM